MIKETKISTGQLFVLMFLSKVFFLMMYTPHGETKIDECIFLFGQILSIPTLFLCLIPFYIIYKKSHSKDIISLSGEIHPDLSKIIGVIYSGICIFIAGNTLANFEYYLTTAIFPQSRGVVFIVTMLLAVVYALYIGIEPVARLGGFVLAVVIISTGIITVPLIKDINMAFYHGLSSVGVKDLVLTTFSATVSNNDLIVLLLVSDLISGDIKKGLPKYIVLSSAFYLFTIFFAITTLGGYSKSLIFPLYSLSAIAELSILQRLDSIHMMIWVFVAFVKVAYLLLVAGYALRRVFNVRREYLQFCAVLLTLISALIISSSFAIFEKVGVFMNTGVLFGIYLIIIPLIILLISKLKIRRIKA